MAMQEAIHANTSPFGTQVGFLHSFDKPLALPYGSVNYAVCFFSLLELRAALLKKQA